MLKTETGKTKTAAKKTPPAATATRKRTAPAAAAKKSATLAVQAASRTHPTREEIARRAYELYLARGGREGSAIDDWLEAERQLANGNGRPLDAAPRKR